MLEQTFLLAITFLLLFVKGEIVIGDEEVDDIEVVFGVLGKVVHLAFTKRLVLDRNVPKQSST